MKASIVLSIATFATLIGMMLTGRSAYNDQLMQHGGQVVSMSDYLVTGHFLSALFENWEGEFLQMSAYVVLISLSSGVRLSRTILANQHNRT